MLRRELARASTRSQHFTLDATHTSLVTDERNAEFIVAKVGQLYDTLASAQATAASN
jgi:hypothetical protein